MGARSTLEGGKAKGRSRDAHLLRTSCAPHPRPSQPRSTPCSRDPGTGVRAGDGSRVRLVFKFNKIQETYTQMRETRVLKTTDVSRSVPVAVSRPQPG